ncbi:hypothetical protein BJ508DRAFT_367478 [Ascobolus immersus RN42]|uniref:Uncharacterized protein n=1 Tax=Ascobolus immersus RN42 TaxID=1160509 RepID=A0A3N4HCD6_ASCIM|nr:hypothetical protein BJ508DRAFT_367478 [Ascobolus immersus RN42]
MRFAPSTMSPFTIPFSLLLSLSTLLIPASSAPAAVPTHTSAQLRNSTATRQNDTWPDADRWYHFSKPWHSITCYLANDPSAPPPAPADDVLTYIANYSNWSQNCTQRAKLFDWFPLPIRITLVHYGQAKLQVGKIWASEKMSSALAPGEKRVTGELPEALDKPSGGALGACWEFANGLKVLYDECRRKGGRVVGGEMVVVYKTRDGEAPRDGVYEGWVPGRWDYGVVYGIEGTG